MLPLQFVLSSARRSSARVAGFGWRPSRRAARVACVSFFSFGAAAGFARGFSGALLRRLPAAGLFVVSVPVASAGYPLVAFFSSLAAAAAVLPR